MPETREKRMPPSKLDSFKFDLQGFSTFRNFFSKAEVDVLNSTLSPICDRQAHSKKFDFITEDVRFVDIMSDRRVLSICESWMGPSFRFAGAWGIHGSPSQPGLHAGPFSAQGLNQYRWSAGRPICACLVFAFILEDQLAGDGGFVILPGSHKASGGEDGHFVFGELFGGRLDYSCVVQPELRAGDLFVFAEATIHGTAGWRPADRFRRNLYYKFTHGFCTYLPESDWQMQILRREARSEQERRLLEGPWARSHGGEQARIAKWRQRTVATDASSPK